MHSWAHSYLHHVAMHSIHIDDQPNTLTTDEAVQETVMGCNEPTVSKDNIKAETTEVSVVAPSGKVQKPTVHLLNKCFCAYREWPRKCEQTNHE